MASLKQQIIMSKAMEIIGNEGIKGLTISHLSQKIGVSDGAIYRHFDSKMAIIREILNELFYHISDQMITEINSNKTTKDKLTGITSQLYRLFEEKPGYVSLLFSEEYFVTDDEIFYLMHTIINTMQLYIRQMLEQGIKLKELKSSIDSQNMALIIMGAMRMAVLNWRLKRSHNGLEMNGKKLINNIITLMEA